MSTFVWHEADSVLHRLNPLTKLFLNVPVFVIASASYEPVTPSLIGVVAVVTTHVLGNVPWSRLLRPFVFALIVSLGMFWTGTVFYAGPGSEVGAPDYWLGPIRITEAGLVYGLAMSGRALAIFATSALFVLTTDPTKLVLALIQQGRLPYWIGYGVFAGYRFIPLLREEFENVRAAHQVRGAGLEGSVVERARQLLGYLIPLLAIAVRRAERVALAMDSRAFGALPNRTYFHVTTIGRVDVVFVLAALAVITAIFLIRELLPWTG